MTQLDFYELNYFPFKRLMKSSWWRNATLFSVRFSRYLIFPALLWLTSLGLVVLSLFFVVKLLNGTIDVWRLFLVALIYFGTALVAIPTMIFSLGTWLVRLTAYCASFDAIPVQAMLSGTLGAELMDAAHQEALQLVRTRKMFFAKYWLAVTLFLVPPALFMVVALLVLAATSAAVLGPAAVTMPLWATTIAYCVLFVSFVFISEVSFVGLFVSGTTKERDVMSLAKRTVVLSFRNILPLGTYTIIGSMLTVFLTSPWDLFRFTQSQELALNITWISVVEEIWRAVSSTVVWTLVLTPMCEFLRGKVSASNP